MLVQIFYNLKCPTIRVRLLCAGIAAHLRTHRASDSVTFLSTRAPSFCGMPCSSIAVANAISTVSKIFVDAADHNLAVFAPEASAHVGADHSLVKAQGSKQVTDINDLLKGIKARGSKRASAQKVTSLTLQSARTPWQLTCAALF